MPTRTKQATAKWLEKQQWYDDFIDNMEIQAASREHIRKCISGEMEEFTITGAFNWILTPEGDCYWNSINKKFIEWYYGNE